MVDLSISIPSKLKKMMERFPEINWSEVLKEAIKEKIMQFNIQKSFQVDSERTPEEALKLGKEISKL